MEYLFIELNKVRVVDSHVNSQPIVRPSKTPQDIILLFDPIVYDKVSIINS